MTAPGPVKEWPAGRSPFGGIARIRSWESPFSLSAVRPLSLPPGAGSPRALGSVQLPRARCRPRPACRCRGGAARTWPANWLPARQLAVSASTIGRWLAGDALKPWQHRSWISVRDPEFAARAARVLDLYAGIWDGQPLGAGDYVICADEKTSIQARCRRHPTLPPGKARAMRVEHDYDRSSVLEAAGLTWARRVSGNRRPFARTAGATRQPGQALARPTGSPSGSSIVGQAPRPAPKFWPAALA